MTDSNKIGMYICIGLASILYALSVYIRTTEKFLDKELAEDKVSLYSKSLTVLSGLLLLISTILALQSKDKIERQDIMNTTIIGIAILASWYISWQDYEWYLGSMVMLIAIIGCFSLET